MSNQGHGTDITLLAAADLSAKQHHAIKVDNTGKAALAAAGDFAIGVLQNNPTSGNAATVRVAGVTKMVADAAVAAGATVASSADAQAATATRATDNILGVALIAAAGAGEVISVLLTVSGTGVAD